MSYWGSANAAAANAAAQAQAQAAVTQYINATNQYNAANILGGGSYMGSGSGTGNLMGGLGVGAYYPVQTGANAAPIQSTTTLTYPGHQHQSTGLLLSAPTGQKVAITFADANGTAWSIDVDIAYVPILQAISQHHQHMAACRPSQGFAVKSVPKMLEGDFSEDEMSQAEQIIQEMGNGSQKQPCECEA